MNTNFNRKDIDLIKAFNCEEIWPICLFDFTFKNRNVEYQIMRSKYNLKKFIVHDYFFAKENFNNKRDFQNDESDVLIEKNTHICN
jgi:hypothetical protein